MEAQGGGGSGEVRRIHIIYFLSRKGRIDHPHLIRVHHLSRNGVRLRDVKRWLSELRGKDMPESFAWSYKRRYKTGYVWQDLLDEDLITPISDNEYVLKGSEIPFNLDFRSHGEKKLVSMEKEPISLDETTNSGDHHRKLSCREEIHEERPETTMDVSTKTSPPLGSEASTTTDEDPNNKKETTDQKSEKFENNFSSFYSTLLNRNKKSNKKNKNEKDNNVDNNNNPSTKASPSSTSTSTTSSSYSLSTKSKSNSSGASNIFRNIISCGAVDTDESAMVMIKRRDKSSSCMPMPAATKNKPDDHNGTTDHCITAEICRGDKLGGSERIFGTSWNQQQQTHTYARRKSCDGMKSSSNWKSEFRNQKPVSAACKPLNGPNCSQCGKMFKPEKMHAHMKSCKGMKSLAKGTTPPASAARASVSEPSRSSIEESLPSNY